MSSSVERGRVTPDQSSYDFEVSYFPVTKENGRNYSVYPSLTQISYIDKSGKRGFFYVAMAHKIDNLTGEAIPIDIDPNSFLRFRGDQPGLLSPSPISLVPKAFRFNFEDILFYKKTVGLTNQVEIAPKNFIAYRSNDPNLPYVILANPGTYYPELALAKPDKYLSNYGDNEWGYPTKMSFMATDEYKRTLAAISIVYFLGINDQGIFGPVKFNPIPRKPKPHKSIFNILGYNPEQQTPDIIEYVEKITGEPYCYPMPSVHRLVTRKTLPKSSWIF